MPMHAILVVFLTLLAGCVYAPSSRGLPPGHGGIPPGHGGIPPGHAKKMGPPAIVVVGTPAFIWVPGMNVAVLRGVEADVFVVKGVYYYYYGGDWYWADHHRGPWKRIHYRHLPSDLRKKSPGELKEMAYGRGKGNKHHKKKGKWDS